MKKTIYKHLVAFVGIFSLLVSLSSCTDKDDVEITYNANLTVSAENIFKPFHPEKPEEFEEMDFCDVNIMSLVYDENGSLIFEKEATYHSLDSKLSFDLALPSGTYTLVSVVKFEGPDFHAWDISGKERISTFEISEVDAPEGTQFETLGFDLRTIEIGDSPYQGYIEVEPITALCQVEFHHAQIIHRFDGSYAFINRTNRFYGALNAAAITQPTFCQTLTIKDSTPVFGYKSQNDNYWFSGYVFDYTKAPDKVNYAYRALLPHDKKTFKWVGFLRGTQNQQLESGTTEPCNGLLSIESGKQYDICLFFDILFLHACEHDAELTPEKKIEQCIPFLDGVDILPDEEQ